MLKDMKYISICIPTYEMHGKGVEFLTHSFEILKKQTFKNFDVVVSDHSLNSEIETLCKDYAKNLDIHYFKNTQKRGNSSANINNAILHATGTLIKILFQDDFLYSNDSLKKIVDSFDLEKDTWLITGSTHSNDGILFFRSLKPYYKDAIILSQNTVSSPSVITIKNNKPLLFDENLIWYMDTDYYKRYFQNFGQPKIISDVNVVNRIGSHQISATLANEYIRENEYGYILKKYKIPLYTLKIVKYKISFYKRKLKSWVKKCILQKQ